MVFANKDYLYALPTFAAKIKLIELERKIRVGAVSYLNTKPLLYGIEHSPVIDEISLITDYPARIADKLLQNEIDIGLVPVAMILKMKEYHINTRFCIGCDGPVASVCLFSEVPLEEIETVLMDYHSRTSVALARLLLEKHWKLNPAIKPAGPDFLNQIKGSTAAVVIGDSALEQTKISAYRYDLGQSWKEMTGLPFVFAAWISNRKLDETWLSKFDRANEFGIENIPELLKSQGDQPFDLRKYYTEHLSYTLDLEKEKGMNLFLKMLSDQQNGSLS
jgi:chorismate dehydratase